MADMNPHALECRVDSRRQAILRRIGVAGDGMYRRDRSKRQEDGGPADIAAVEDEIDTGESGDSFRPDQSVRVGDEAHEHAVFRLAPDCAERQQGASGISRL